MGAQSRRDLIESLVTSNGEIDFSSLATEFGVSEMTIRRDVDALENKGVLRRVVGGAISLAGKSAEPSFKDRSTAATLAKIRIAEATVELLVPNETVIIDSGSTALAVARALKGRGLGLTVITPSIQVAIELADEEATTVILTGGLVRPGELSLIGFETEQAFARYNCDTFIMGIAGFDAERGVTDYHRDESEVKHAALKVSDRVIVVADTSKLARVQLVNVADTSQIDVLVTDAEDSNADVAACRALGVDVICVPVALSAVSERAS
jgi:DeoR/GlpR family transcriptional regulator of sugar metabolism